MRSHKETDPRVILTLALKGVPFQKQGKKALLAWVAQQPEFCHEAHPGKPVVDLVPRLITLATQFPCVWTHMHLMPHTGRGALRELRKLTSGGRITRNEQLLALLERGTVHPGTTRTDIDNIHSQTKRWVGKTEVAPRHRGQRT